MQTLETKLLNALLDGYERSRGYAENRAQKQRIRLRMYGDARCDFTDYDIEDHAARCAVNDAAQTLASQNLVSLEWMRGEEGHILHRIVLCPGAVNDAYRFCARTPLADTAAQLENRLVQAQQEMAAEWAQQYLAEELDFLRRNRRPRANFPADGVELDGWLIVLRAAAAQSAEHPLLERVFSVRYLGDSKAFENRYRTRLLSVLEKHLLPDADEMTAEDRLRQVGLEKYPEWFSLCGAVRFYWSEDRTLDAAPLRDGLQISASDVQDTTLRLAPQVRILLFIENKANYYDYIRNHTDPTQVVVYHGGFYSPQRGRFFQKLCRAAGLGVRLLHWGDIDLGGFQMDSRLRREVDPRILPWRMSKTELTAHRDQAANFDDTYVVKLTELLDDPMLRDSRETLLYMLQHRLRLEQEVLIEDAP